jgi:hypothetical protein
MPNQEDREGEVRTSLVCLYICHSPNILQTSLHKAALNGHLHIVTYLISRNADVQARDADGWTPLHNACSKAIISLVQRGWAYTHKLIGISRYCPLPVRRRRNCL